MCNLGICHECTQNNLFEGQVYEGKYYVNPGTVYVSPKGIYLIIENECMQISCLLSDDNGVYVPIDDLKSLGRTWICGVCYYENPSYCKYCQVCGSERPSKTK